MLVISLRTLIIYLTLIVVMRFMGKRQIGEMQPFEFVITLIIADLACVPMADVSIPLLYGIVSILVLFLLHQLISLIEQSGDFAKRLVSGKPSVVITREGVNFLELKRNNLGVEDLIESMRASGYFFAGRRRLRHLRGERKSLRSGQAKPGKAPRIAPSLYIGGKNQH